MTIHALFVRRCGPLAVAAAISATSLSALFSAAPAWAQQVPVPDSQQAEINPQNFMPDPPSIAAKAWVLMDAASGNIIYQSNEHERLPPASLTKLMTAYAAEYELAAGRLHMDDKARVSVNAWRTGGSRMFIKPNTEVSIEDLLRGLIVVSGNDAAVALAEHISGTEDAFAQVMNEHAKMLGLQDTHYVNPTGLPADNHYTTAYDLAYLARHIIQDFPTNYAIYKEKYFVHDNIKQPNRQVLLWRDPRVDGLKTGFTDAAGYCMVTSGVQGNTRLIAVVLGTDSEAARAQQSETLLNYGFRYYHTQKLYDADHVVDNLRVWGGESTTIPVGFSDPTYITLPAAKGKLTQKVEMDTNIAAPVKKGQQVGTLTVLRDDKEISTKAIIALKDNGQGGIFRRGWDSVVKMVTGWF